MGAQGMLDEAAEAIVAPLRSQLELVTGNPADLREKAGLWQQAAQTVREQAGASRADVATLRASWRGDAADAFAAEMSEHDEALRGMAEDMDATADCLRQAADACEQAEKLIQELIKELIEAIVVASAASTVAAFFTAGLSELVGALADAAEAAVYVGRAATVVERLGLLLRKVQKALEELTKAQKAAKAYRRAKKDLKALGHGRRAARDLAKHAKPTLRQRGKAMAGKSATKKAAGVHAGFGQLGQTALGDLSQVASIDPSAPFAVAPPADPSAIRDGLHTTLVNQAGADEPPADPATVPRPGPSE